MSGQPRTWGRLAVGLIFCLFLGGCGAGPDCGQVVRALDLCSTLPVIKVGLVAPFEGRYRTLGYEVLYAVKVAVRERNASGGVAGYMVELVALDDGKDTASRQFLAHKFAVDERVMGVIGPFSDDSAYAVAQTYQEVGMPLITPVTCLAPGASGMGNAFCLGASPEALADRLAREGSGTTRGVVLRAGSAEDWEPDGLSWGDLLEGRGWEIQEPLDWRERPAGVYLYEGDVLAASDLLVEMRAEGVRTPVLGGPMLARTQLAQIAGDAVAGACHAVPAPVLGEPDETFIAEYQRLGGGVPGPWAALAYDAGVLLLDALEREIQRSGQPTRDGVGSALTHAQGPDGTPVFVDRRRRHVEILLLCYRAGDRYPGSLVR